jgi:hypothetical protein
MFNPLKSLMSKPVKNLSANPLAQAMQNIEKVKEGNNVNQENNELKYAEIFNKGIYFMNKFAENSDTNGDLSLLFEASQLFTEALEIKKNRPEPYFFLTHIFLLIDEVSYALKYLKVLSFLEPSYPGLEDLKAMISDNSQIKQSSENTVSTPVKANKPLPGTVTSVSYKQVMAQSKQRPINKLIAI